MTTEKRLIDAYKLEDLLQSNVAKYHHKDDVIAAIAGQPTVDAVEVVRCKECKCAYINSFSASSGVAVCKHWSNEAKTVIVQQDDFCSYGERRNDG